MSILENKVFGFLKAVYQDYELDKIPIVGQPLSIFNLVMTARDHFLIYKLERFLSPLGDIPDDEKIKYIGNIKNDKNLRDKVGKILLELDSLDDERKPDYAGKLFLAYLRDRFNAEEHEALRFGLRHSYVPDLEELRQFFFEFRSDASYYGQRHNNKLGLQRLAYCGFLTGPSQAYELSLYHISRIGQLFVQFAILDGA